MPKQVRVDLEARIPEHRFVDLRCKRRRAFSLAVLTGEQRSGWTDKQMPPVLTDVPCQKVCRVRRYFEVDQMLVFDLLLRYHKVEPMASLDQVTFDIEADEITHPDRDDQQDRDRDRLLRFKSLTTRRKF